MNILLIAGMAIFIGTATGKIFQRMKVPQVVGYIIVGVLIGKSFFRIFEGRMAESLIPLVNFTLGVIGCVIGAELKGGIFRKFGRSIYAVLLGEGLLAFAAVTLVVTFLTGKLYLGLILGAVASATDPASTINVLWEYKAKGPLTRTLTSVVAMDDGLALIIYGLVSVFAKAMIIKQHFSWLEGLVMPLIEIFKCLLLGIIGGLVIISVIKHIKEEELVLSFVLGVVACLVGIAMYFQMDLILTSMAMGMTIANMIPQISEKIFGSIRKMTTSLYILFFVAIGAQLDIRIFANTAILAVVLAYVASRSFGKIFGAMLGGYLSGAKASVTKYSGLCLFTQGGVAMGLALSIHHNLSTAGSEGQQVGLMVVNIVAATTFIVQLIGPPLVKFGIAKADEMNRDVTKEDIVKTLKVSDVMETKFSIINAGAHLKEIIRTVKEEEAYNLPVVNRANELMGLITLRELKDALLEEDLQDIILAEDVAVPSRFQLSRDQPLSEVCAVFEKRDLEFLPVVEGDGSRKVVGIVEYRGLMDALDKRLLERHNGGE